MKKSFADLLVESSNGLFVGLIENYSGREMYGATTTAIEYETPNYLLLVIAVAAVVANHNEDLEEFLRQLAEFRYDSTARNLLVY